MTWPDSYLIPGIKPFHQEDAGIIYCGDCLTVMTLLPDDSMDLFITDPPYSSGARQANQLRARKGMLRSEKFKDEWFGTDNASSHGFMFFMRGICIAAIQSLKQGSHLYSFIDWRNYPLLSGVSESAGWRINNMLVWDKKIFGMGNGYRNQHELIIVASKGQPKEYNRHDLANILHSKRFKQDQHPTEKPLSIIKPLVEMSSNEGDIILDPFLGSGTTAVAAKELGRKFIGIEISEEYCAIAKKRLRQGVLPL